MRWCVLILLLAACGPTDPAPTGAGSLADLTDPDAAPAEANVEYRVPEQPTQDDALGRGKLGKGDYAEVEAELRCLGEQHLAAVLRAHNAEQSWLTAVRDRIASEPEKQARIAQEIDQIHARICPDGQPNETVRGRLGPAAQEAP